MAVNFMHYLHWQENTICIACFDSKPNFSILMPEAKYQLTGALFFQEPLI